MPSLTYAFREHAVREENALVVAIIVLVAVLNAYHHALSIWTHRTHTAVFQNFLNMNLYRDFSENPFICPICPDRPVCPAV
jgi:uncharacterized membrane protein